MVTSFFGTSQKNLPVFLDSSLNATVSNPFNKSYQPFKTCPKSDPFTTSWSDPPEDYCLLNLFPPLLPCFHVAAWVTPLFQSSVHIFWRVPILPKVKKARVLKQSYTLPVPPLISCCFFPYLLCSTTLAFLPVLKRTKNTPASGPLQSYSDCQKLFSQKSSGLLPLFPLGLCLYMRETFCDLSVKIVNFFPT